MTLAESQNAPETLRINGDRLWDRIQEMGKIGATPGGGCNRQALTDLDREARDLFCAWAKSIGCTIIIDQVGNIRARRKGIDNAAAPVIAGSHLDTQPTGGRFDGVYGVLAALEVLETLERANVQTDRPMEAVVWTNEEGARFEPAMIGSGVVGGAFTLEEAYSSTDREGKTLGGELTRIGYNGSAPIQWPPIHAAFEAHIEQGPVLEATGNTIGIVRGVQGMRWLKVTLTGAAVHAGPTPMDMRRDPVFGLQMILRNLYLIAEGYGADARLTIGQISASPGATNTVPDCVEFSLDLRHPDQRILDEYCEQARNTISFVARSTNLSFDIQDVWNSPAVAFDENCVRAVRSAASDLDLPNQTITSGAGHDSVYVSRIAPTAMIFVPCKDGISHNEAEFASREHLEAGANVLMRAMLKRSIS